MNDETAIRTLEPLIDALKASISMQKAITNNFPALEKLRAVGYSNRFISDEISSRTGKAISTGLFASMMFRARKKSSAGIQNPQELRNDPLQKAPRTFATSKPRQFKHNPTPPADLLD